MAARRRRHTLLAMTIATSLASTAAAAQQTPLAQVPQADATPAERAAPAGSAAASEAADAPQASAGAPAQAGDDTVQQLDAVQVRGVRGSVEDAVDAKRSRADISDSIVAEDVGKLPDNSVAAALQRVTGVQVSRGGAEASGVLVRGLPNIVTTFNGRNIFTASGRGMALQDIPAEMLQAVDVYKTSGAEFVEGGIAGVVDVRLRRPFDLEPGGTVAGSLGATYGDQAEDTKPIGTLTAANSWDSGYGRMGVLGSVSLQQRPFQESTAFNDIYTLVDNPADPSEQVFLSNKIGANLTRNNHKRRSANFSFQWAPTDNSELYFDTFYVNYEGRNHVNFFMPLTGLVTGDNVESVTLRPGTNIVEGISARDLEIVSSTQAHKQTSDTVQLALGGTWENDRVELSSELAYTWSTNKSRAMTLDFTTDGPLVHVDSSGDAPNVQVTGADGSPYDVTDPSIWALSQYYDDWARQRGIELAWRGDATFQLGDGFFRALDAGLRASRRTATAVGGGGVRDNLSGSPVFLDQVPGLAAITPGNVLDGARDFGTDRWAASSYDFHIQRSDRIRELMGQPLGRPDENPALYFDNEEKNYAAYLQLHYGFALGSVPVDGRIGVRATRLESSLNGTSTIDGEQVPSQFEKTRTEILPSFSANLSLHEDVVLRLAASQTISLPSFGNLNPQLALFESTDTLPARGSGGNPDLDPITSDNFDASLEWYFQPGSLLSLAVFRRDIDGYIQSYADDEVIDGVTYSITRPRNTGEGRLQGAEIGYTQFYDFLPGWLSGFGTQLNYTWIDAEAESPTGEMQPLAQVSRNAFNAVLMYQLDRFSARLAYNRRGAFTSSFSASGDQPGEVREGDQEWLDVAFNYDLNDNMTLFAEATNLLGGNTYNYFGDPSYPRDFASRERTYTVGFRFRL